MGTVDGSLGRAVFQGSPGEVFRGSCGARKRSEGHLLLAGLPTRLCFPSALLYSLYLRFSFLASLFLALSSPFRGYSTYGRTRRTPPPLHAKKARKSSSRFASLVKRMRDFAYRTLSRFPFSLSLVIILCLSFDFVPSSFASAISLLFFHLLRGRRIVLLTSSSLAEKLR